MAIITSIIQFIGCILSLVGAKGKKGYFALRQYQLTVAKWVVDVFLFASSALLSP